MARKRELFNAADELKRRGVGVILVQIHEAHSSAWPTGLDNQPEPQMCLLDRVARAQEFIAADRPPFPVLLDTWDDTFEQVFRAWPDKYYLIDRDMRIIAHSTYGANADALIDIDCIKLVRQIIAHVKPLELTTC